MFFGKYKFLSLTGILGLITISIFKVYQQPDSTKMDISDSHHLKSGFRNIDPTPEHGFADFLKWRFNRPRRAPIYSTVDDSFPVVEPDWDRIRQPESGMTVTWIGHSTLLVQFEGFNLLTDPVFSNRSSPVQFAGPERICPLPFQVEELPEIHAVFISHNHYDHLDRSSVTKLGNNPVWFVPLGLKQWFEKVGVSNTIELDWWENYQMGNLKIICTPTQHFSGRNLFDRNRALWCSWVIAGQKYRFWFAGDTGYGTVFKQIGNRYGPFDLAAIPIGAYNPEWFMLPLHVNPPQAIQIHRDVEAKQSVGIHWGTFILTDEPAAEPRRWLEKLIIENEMDPNEFFIMKHGETRVLGLKTD